MIFFNPKPLSPFDFADFHKQFLTCRIKNLYGLQIEHHNFSRGQAFLNE